MIHNNKYDAILIKFESLVNHLNALINQGFTLVEGFSGGKDSLTLLIGFLEALRRTESTRKHYVIHTNTAMENAEMDVYSARLIDQLNRYIVTNKLPVEVVVLGPGLVSDFFVTSIGRGKLHTYKNSSQRQCSVDLKIKPAHRFMKSLVRDSASPVLQLSGSRLSESTIRHKNMSSRKETSNDSVAFMEDVGIYTAAPIAEWDLLDVWDIIMATDQRRSGPIKTFAPHFDETIEIYKNSNSGTCAILVGDQGSKSGCGSRTGCSVCLAVGDKDKSMSSMIEMDTDRYGYMEGMNNFRNYLANAQYDWTKSGRTWFQRSVSKAGYLGISPDNYSSEMKLNMLRWLLTLDALEIERAEEHSAKLFLGEIERTPENRAIQEPMFQYLTPKHIIAICFYWSIYGDSNIGFAPLREWHEIHNLGKRYAIPEVSSDSFPKRSVPKRRWMHIGNQDVLDKMPGLRNLYDPKAKRSWRPDVKHHEKAYRADNQWIAVSWFDESKEFHIDGASANMFLDDFCENLYDVSADLNAQQAVTYLLDRGLISMPAKEIKKYHQIAKRHQLMNYLKVIRGLENVEDLIETECVISEREHNELLARIQNEEKAAIQDMMPDLFGDSIVAA